MASAIRPVDVSVTWPRCKCECRHAPTAPCPPRLVWLVAGTPVYGINAVRR